MPDAIADQPTGHADDPDQAMAAGSLEATSRATVGIAVHSRSGHCLQREENWSDENKSVFIAVWLVNVVLKTKVLIERWQVQYNSIRAHGRLGYCPMGPESLSAMDDALHCVTLSVSWPRKPERTI